MRLVMTNGVFDILHRGHVDYLNAAARFGRRLWIALNSDASVRKIKGEKRPLMPFADRAEILLAMECVDNVVPFDEETPELLYSKLLPDVLVKGSDYKVEQIAGAKVVLAAGGKVELVDLVPERSTTRIIDKILKSYGTK
jgi:D-beta-D-heptose 7-phosphate kinase/D-beta-D-heptose 1-phosphate adenosyltransferase